MVIFDTIVFYSTVVGYSSIIIDHKRNVRTKLIAAKIKETQECLLNLRKIFVKFQCS